jgi:hypothetical protein
VIPVSLKYAHAVRRGTEQLRGDPVPWYGDISLLPHFWDVLALGHIDVSLHFNQAINGACEESGERKTRKALTAETCESVRAGCALLRGELPHPFPYENRHCLESDPA